jgi:hypothetical protein
MFYFTVGILYIHNSWHGQKYVTLDSVMWLALANEDVREWDIRRSMRATCRAGSVLLGFCLSPEERTEAECWSKEDEKQVRQIFIPTAAWNQSQPTCYQASPSQSNIHVNKIYKLAMHTTVVLVTFYIAGSDKSTHEGNFASFPRPRTSRRQTFHLPPCVSFDSNNIWTLLDAYRVSCGKAEAQHDICKLSKVIWGSRDEDGL